MAEQLRRSIASFRVTGEQHQLQITASFGLAASHPKLETREKLLAAADKALYAAKAGSNDTP
jgi:PleD family two-component response regulator